MENASELEGVVEWMRLHGVKGYTRLPSGGFSLELFEDQISPQLDWGDPPPDPYSDPDLLPDGKRPRLPRIPK